MEKPKKYSNTAINNNFVAWKSVYVVATELSRAQLCLNVQIKTYLYDFYPFCFCGTKKNMSIFMQNVCPRSKIIAF